MQKVADYVLLGSVVADIGTDHAYLPIALVQMGKIKRAIAIDVKQGPYENACNQVAKFGVDKFVQVRLGDGLKPLELGEADTAVLAGMGGALMIEILSASQEVVANLKHIVMQPQNGFGRIRKYLIEHHWKIVEECLLEDEDIYTVLHWEQGSMQELSWLELELGPMIIAQKGALFQPYVNKKIEDLSKVQLELKKAKNSIVEEKMLVVTSQIAELREVLK